MANITIYRKSDLYAISNPAQDARLVWIPYDKVGFIEAIGGATLTVTYSPVYGGSRTWTGAAVEVLNQNGEPYGATNLDVMQGLQTGYDVTLQDPTSPLIDSYFLQSTGTFSLAADMVASTVDILEYDMLATAGHGIIVTDEILLIDVLDDISFYAVVVGVAGDVITLDRPIDHSYEAATTLGRTVISNMAVNGSITPQIFTVRGGALEAHDITRMFLTMLSASSMDDGKFGSLLALTNGLVLRVVDGYQQVIFNFKTNQDIKQFAYDLSYSTKSAAGQHGLVARMSFAGQDKHGAVIRLNNVDALQWIVQDDLTGLISIKGSAQGSHVVY